MSKKCFFVSPIGEEGSDIRKTSDQLLRHIIQPACASHGLEVQRADQMPDPGSITEAMIHELETADLVIADLTGHNPNVFYEIGYRQARGLPYIHLRQPGTVLPFDVAGTRALNYNLNDLDEADKARERLGAMIGAALVDTSAPDTSPSAAITPTDLMPILYFIEDAIERIPSRVKALMGESRAMPHTTPVHPHADVHNAALGSMEALEQSISRIEAMVNRLPPAEFQGNPLRDDIVAFAESLKASVVDIADSIPSTTPSLEKQIDRAYARVEKIIDCAKGGLSAAPGVAQSPTEASE